MDAKSIFYFLFYRCWTYLAFLINLKDLFMHSEGQLFRTILIVGVEENLVK
jgi:hypothetical protein